MSSIWNNRISISIFGESNGPAIGVTVDNLPSGEYIDTEALARFMARRNIGRNKVRENVMPHVMSGIYNDRTTGTPLCAFIQNVSAKAPQHSNLDRLSRTGHADYTGAVRYRGINDFRDEGHFTDRLTIPLCFAGAICAQILERRGIYTGAHVLSIHGIKDNPFDPVNITRDGVKSIRDKDFPVINDRRGWLMQDDIYKAKEAGELVIMISTAENNTRVMKSCMKEAREAAEFLRDEKNDIEEWQLAGINAMFDQCNKESMVSYDMPTAIKGLLCMQYQ